jgi:peptidoglycan/xylan/chitin deacetylase (PgdA/CDA1 family)
VDDGATVSVVFPALEMWADRATRSGGRRAVALTFDDGPHPVTTRRILAALAGTRHRATFFVLGTKARRHRMLRGPGGRPYDRAARR